VPRSLSFLFRAAPHIAEQHHYVIQSENPARRLLALSLLVPRQIAVVHLAEQGLDVHFEQAGQFWG